MIYTLTLNTAIDMNIRCQSLSPNTVNRTLHTEYSPNGKAVNVSIVLNKFGKETTALGFFGGFSGKYIIDELSKQNIITLPCWIDDITRINVFINERGNDDGRNDRNSNARKSNEYKLVGKGPFVPNSKQYEMLSLIESLDNGSSNNKHYLVISGSLPNNIEPDYYDLILSLCQKKNIHIILDISHPKLSDLLHYRPLLIKPNNDEVQEIFGLATDNTPQTLLAIDTMHSLGAQNILLTMGERGLYFSNGQQIWFCDAVPVELVSSACAGDAALAAFLSLWLPAQHNVELAMKKASATGADVAQSDGLGLLNHIDAYMEQLSITQIR